MVRDIRYIIKRIIIGAGIAICMYFFRNYLFMNTYAMTVSNYFQRGDEYIIDNMTTYIMKSTNGNPFSVWAGTSGYVVGSFALHKVSGDNTSINVFPKQVYVNTNTNPASYVCEVGSAMVGNSAFNGGTFTYKCPVNMGTAGITEVVFDFQNIQTNWTAQYRLTVGSLLSYEIVENSNQAIGNQMDNDNANTNKIVTAENALKGSVDNVNNSVNNINNTLNNDNTTEANTKGNNFFNNFQTNSHGLSGIITAPIRLVNSLTTATCNPLEFDLPIIHNHVVLPCIRPIIENYFGVFFTLYQLITTGLISYTVCINLYSKVRALQNPNNDRIEVLNL